MKGYSAVLFILTGILIGLFLRSDVEASYFKIARTIVSIKAIILATFILLKLSIKLIMTLMISILNLWV
jgi:hypothetical protein